MKALAGLLLLALLWLVPLGQEARAERLIASVSNHRVTITPDYAGEELVLFGSVERDADTPPNRGPYDIVVTVSGPRMTMLTRRKEKRLGIWLNADSREFINVPSYLAVFSNRPSISKYGMPVCVCTRSASEAKVPAPFGRLRPEPGLYREASNALAFLTPTLFRVGIPLPPEVPIGTYDVDIKLFANGALITRTDTAFEIAKVGFEQFVADAARRHGWLYGIATAIMALMTGWLASIIFRKD